MPQNFPVLAPIYHTSNQLSKLVRVVLIPGAHTNFSSLKISEG